MAHSTTENKPTFNTFEEVAKAFGLGIRQTTIDGQVRFILTSPDGKAKLVTRANQTPDQFFNQVMTRGDFHELVEQGTLQEPNVTTEGPGTQPTVQPAGQVRVQVQLGTNHILGYSY